MPHALILIVGFCQVSPQPGPGQKGDDFQVTPRQVLELLGGIEFKQQRAELIRLGGSAFPAYEAILSDPHVSGAEVWRIFGIVSDVKADGRRFVEHAIRRLSDPDADVRRSSAQVLARIGSQRDASAIVALLWDEDMTVTYAAAATLAAIGSEREITALDIWIRSGNHRQLGDLRHHVKQFRDALQRKVEEQKKGISS